jgi:hypothetical protein
MMIQDQSMFAKEHLHSQFEVVLMKEVCEVILSRDFEVHPLNMNRIVKHNRHNQHLLLTRHPQTSSIPMFDRIDLNELNAGR